MPGRHTIESGPCVPLPKRAAHISSSLCASKLASSSPLIMRSVRDENSCVKHQRMFPVNSSMNVCQKVGAVVCTRCTLRIELSGHRRSFSEIVSLLNVVKGRSMFSSVCFSKNWSIFTKCGITRVWLPYHALSSLRWVTATWRKLERQWCRLIWRIEVSYGSGPYENWTLVCSLMSNITAGILFCWRCEDDMRESEVTSSS